MFNAVHSRTALIGKGEIKKVTWVPTKDQLADCLTKRGSSPLKLL